MLSHSTTLPAARATRPSRVLHVSLWAVQLLLAALFFLVGYTHAAAPIEVAIQRAPWVASLPVALVRFIGVAELAGAIGLLLPAATRIRPMLTPLAAVGLATMMALAVPFHQLRGEASAVVINVVLGSLAAFVALGRARWAPIVDRSAARRSPGSP
ncbi:MAG TPA: DoxX family protein [Gemmatimonadaceae bacterium]